MKVRGLYTARQLESLRQASPDYHGLYRQMAEATTEDCWSIDPVWLLEHPEQWERVKACDEELTALDQQGAGESEYGAALARMAKCIQDARVAYEREREQAGEKAAVQ
jgi:hypothetical protein